MLLLTKLFKSTYFIFLWYKWYKWWTC